MKSVKLGPLLALALAACAPKPLVVPPPPDPPQDPPAAATSAPSAEAPAVEDPSFRKEAPPAGPEVKFVAPQIQEARLKNGLRVLLVERHEMPIVAVSVSVDRGADQATPGLAGLFAQMLLAGTKTRSALALSDEFGALGASFGAFADYDEVNVSAQALAQKAPELFALVSDVLQNPAFDKAELERERSRRLTSILQQNDSPSALLGNAVAEKLYPAGHPYQKPLIGTEEALKKVQTDDLARFHAAHVRPDRITVAIAGDIDRAAAMALVEKNFGAWQGKANEAKVPQEPPPPAKGEGRVLLVDRPGATQSMVAVTLVGVPRKSPDYDALSVMNTLLGGQFSSRLNLNLREKHAYTYGARSGFDMRHAAGPFTAGGAIDKPATGPAIKEILAEIERIRTTKVGEDELSDAKANLVRQLPARFETAGETASTLQVLSVYGLPLDEFATRPARIAKVTADDVQRVAQKYLRPEHLRVIVVGEAATVEKDLESLGLGKPEVRLAKKKGDKEEKPAAGGGKTAEPKKGEGGKAGAKKGG
jgi:predicted Zn-dependent peptidase